VNGTALRRSLIRFPGDQLGPLDLGHQWNLVALAMVVRSSISAQHRLPTAASRSWMLSKCLLVQAGRLARATGRGDGPAGEDLLRLLMAAIGPTRIRRSSPEESGHWGTAVKKCSRRALPNLTHFIPHDLPRNCRRSGADVSRKANSPGCGRARTRELIAFGEHRMADQLRQMAQEVALRSGASEAHHRDYISGVGGEVNKRIRTAVCDGKSIKTKTVSSHYVN
jgi:hypothetical protein